MKKLPLIFKDNGCKLFGVFRLPPLNLDTLHIFIPALTGTGIGPQNIYVHIAKHLFSCGIASLCIELPSAGGSYNKKKVDFASSSYKQYFIKKYQYFLDKIFEYINSNFKSLNIVLVSISVGCIPILHYCKQKNLAGGVLLSPNPFEDNFKDINKKNFQNYYLKLLKKNTWKKLINLSMNPEKILNNIISENQNKANLFPKVPFTKSKLICIFGERDFQLKYYLNYREESQKKNPSSSYTQVVIPNIDHSFFLWDAREELARIIKEWIKKTIC